MAFTIDMGTGEVEQGIITIRGKGKTPSGADSARPVSQPVPEPQLQIVDVGTIAAEKPGLPPELAHTNIGQFVDDMSG